MVFPSVLLTAFVEIATETWLNQVKLCTFISSCLLCVVLGVFSLKKRKEVTPENASSSSNPSLLACKSLFPHSNHNK